MGLRAVVAVVAPFIVVAEPKQIGLPQPLSRTGAIADLLSLGSNTSHARHGRAKADGNTVAKVITSLTDILNNIEGYQDAAKDLAAEKKAECLAASNTLESLIRSGGRDQQEASEDLQAISAEAEGIESELNTTQDKVIATASEIDSLVAELKALRENHSEEEAQTTASLQQIEAVIAQTSTRERSARRERAKAAKIGSQLRSQVSKLEELGESLGASEPPSLLQKARAHRARHGKHKGHGHHRLRGGATAADKSKSNGVVVLQEDRQQLEEADTEAAKEFDEEEKRLIELIRLKRAELKKLEASVKDLQPALADKLKQAAETNRTVQSSSRGVVRDQALLDESKTVCQTMATVSEAEVAMRFKLSGVLKMAKTILESMDATLFLARDIKDLDPAPHNSPAPHVEEVVQSVEQAPAFVQVSARATNSRALTKEAAEEDAKDTSNTAGPFDEVASMISALIDQLKEQVAGDTDQHQFCTESVAQNRQQRLNVQGAIDVKKSEILWAETAVARLDDQVAFFEADEARLREAATSAEQDLEDERQRRGVEANDRTIAGQTVYKAIDVLTELCHLDPVALLDASKIRNYTGEKKTMCEQARELLVEAVSLIESNTQGFTDNLGTLTNLLNGMKETSEQAAQDRNSDLLSARRARARRADELSAAKTDVEAKERDLALILQSEKELETNCGPKQETHEERMQRREEEIEALKNALSVLEGESVPVGSSFIEEGDDSD